MRVAVLCALLALAACPPAPDPPPPWNPDATAPFPDAAPSSCEAACNVLLASHCYEGTLSTCLPALEELDERRNFAGADGKPVTCAAVSLVTSAASAQRLGIVCKGAPQ